MRQLTLPLLLLSMLARAAAQTDAPAAAELTTLVRDFLKGAGRDDVAAHDRFWADDLIYTASAGRRMGKAEIMAEVRGSSQPEPRKQETVYTAEDIHVHQYGDTAVFAFRLVATSTKDGRTEVANFLNTGTFVKREGRWQAVSWQATAVPKIPATSSTPAPTP